MLFLLLLLLCAGQVLGDSSAPPRCDGRYENLQDEHGGSPVGSFEVEDPCGPANMTVSIAYKTSRQSQLSGIMVKEETAGQTPTLRYYVSFPVRRARMQSPEIIQITFNNRVLCTTEAPWMEGFAVDEVTHVLTSSGTQTWRNNVLVLSSEHGRTRTCQLPKASSVVNPHGSGGSASSPRLPRPTRVRNERPSPPSQGTNSQTTTRKPPAIGQNEEFCGLSVRPQELKLGSNKVEKGDWPWLAPLYDLKTATFKCAGVLINKRFVVIAAHCLVHPARKTPVTQKELVVILGKFDFSKWAERDLQPRQIRRIIHHPGFQPDSLTNDIALLYLDEDVEYTMYARPICLWEDDVSIESLGDQEATLVGWNLKEVRPRLATVPVVSRQQCTAFAGQVAESTFCAGNMTASKHCIGNGDGGLLVPRVGEDGIYRWFLRGIPSYHLQNNAAACKRGGYVVYTDTAPYTAWIREVMRTSRPFDE